MTMRNFEDMSAEEQRAAFETWRAKRESRRSQTTARRSAVKALVAAHQVEYKKLLVAAGGKPARD